MAISRHRNSREVEKVPLDGAWVTPKSNGLYAYRADQQEWFCATFIILRRSTREGFWRSVERCKALAKSDCQAAGRLY
jgi:hypothetical protein